MGRVLLLSLDFVHEIYPFSFEFNLCVIISNKEKHCIRCALFPATRNRMTEEAESLCYVSTATTFMQGIQNRIAAS